MLFAGKRMGTLKAEASILRMLPPATVPVKTGGCSKALSPQHEHYFNPAGAGDVFPPPAQELHCLDDYVDIEGGEPPSAAHPYG